MIMRFRINKSMINAIPLFISEALPATFLGLGSLNDLCIKLIEINLV
jgi:hypothetical protein